MEAKNPYRSNEFCWNWQDNLIATSMGDAYEVGKHAGIREVVDWIKEMADIEKVGESPNLIGFTMLSEDWQSKLKEWGIIE